MLNIDPELVIELHQQRIQAETAIVLGPNGWERGVWTEGPPDHSLIAVTLDDLSAAGYDEDDDLDEDGAQALLRDGDYLIPGEGGETAQPGEETDWAVVTGTYDPESARPEDLTWQEAWWFDAQRATLVIKEDGEARADGRKAHEIWVTGGGKWLLRLRTRWIKAVDGQWCQLDHQTAAQMIYEADPNLLASEETDLPLLARAARAARDLADLMSYDIPQGDYYHSADVQAWRARGGAVGHVHTAHAIGELVRGRLQPAVRDGRQGAAWTLRMAHDGNTTHAAEEAGLTRTTFLGLLR